MYLTLIAFVHDDHRVVQIDNLSVKNVMSDDYEWCIASISRKAQISNEFASHVNIAATRLQVTLSNSLNHNNSIF